MKRISAGLLAIAISGCSMLPFGQFDDGWTTLIDGTSGMEFFNPVGDADWRAADGAVQADKGGKTPGYLVSKSSYGDFMIRVEFWASDNANSGIFMRCQDPKVITDRSCYEANIFDQRPDPSFGTGAIVHVAKIASMPKAGGKWNVYEITAQGPKLSVKLNGQPTVEVEDKQFASGPIALQWGRGTIKFRKVQIKRI